MDATSSDVTLDVNGAPVRARLGDTLAAALWPARVHGLFCGMGVCNECLVTVDGQESKRACMTKVTGPHRIERQSVPVRLPPLSTEGAAPILVDDLEVRTPDLLVIGGGAGGMNAAAIAAEAGLKVVLVDERAKLGGQFFKQPGDNHAYSDSQTEGGRARIERVHRAGVEVISGAEAWGAFAPLTVGVTTAAESLLFKPRRLIVATGAYERGLAVPGWTLPGVMTTGAAQTLFKTDGVLPGKRILVCGNGPLNPQVALELARAGAEVAAVVEAASKPGLAHAAALMSMAANGLDLLASGMSMMAELKRRGIPLLHGDRLARVDQEGALAATLASGKRFTVDAVLMGYGFLPSNELLRALGCRHEYDAARDQLVTLRDETCETSVPGVHAIGDCCGLGGAKAAADEGVIAGAAVVRALGGTPPPVELAAARVSLQRSRRFQRALWQVFAASRPLPSQPDAIVCRCEQVTLGAVTVALADGDPDIGEVKRRTRLGMGRCQGRYCASALAGLLGDRQGRIVDELAFFAPRVPAKPVSIGDLVRVAKR